MDPKLYGEMARQEDSHWWFTGRRAVIRELLTAHLPAAESRRILDVGCGTGGMLPLLADFGAVEGLESSSEGVSYSRARMGDSTVIHRGELPGGVPKGAVYELITAFDVLEHLAEPVEALVQLRAGLTPGGTFVCTVPAHPFLWSHHDELNHHQRRYTEGTLREHLSEGGFQVRHLSYFNTALFAPIAAVRLAQRLAKPFWPPSERSDLSATPDLLNRALEQLLSAERHWVARRRLPFGISLLAVAVPR